MQDIKRRETEPFHLHVLRYQINIHNCTNFKIKRITWNIRIKLSQKICLNHCQFEEYNSRLKISEFFGNSERKSGRIIEHLNGSQDITEAEEQVV